MIAISVDSPEENARVIEKLRLGFPILSDPKLKVIDAFGLRHVGGMMGQDISRPAVFILDESGKVLWKKLTDSYRIRVRPQELLQALSNASK